MTKKVFNMNGGRHSQAALSAFINALYGTSVANGLNIVAPGGTGLKVTVKAGTANIDTGLGYGHMVQADADETITLAAASPSLPRNSLIVGYIDKSVSPTTTVIDNTNGIFKIKEIAGTPAASPQDPPASVIQSGVGATNPYIVFGRVRINANATSLAQTSIMDMRKMVGLPFNGDYLENGSVSGSKIAQTTIKADNIDFTTLPDNKYSTNEQDTGQKWIDGRPIYRKVVRGTVNMTGNSTSRLAHGIQGLTSRWELIKYYGNMRLGGTLSNNLTKQALPYIENAHQSGITSIDETTVTISGSYPWGSSEVSLVLEYVK